MLINKRSTSLLLVTMMIVGVVEAGGNDASQEPVVAASAIGSGLIFLGVIGGFTLVDNRLSSCWRGNLLLNLQDNNPKIAGANGVTVAGFTMIGAEIVSNALGIPKNKERSLVIGALGSSVGALYAYKNVKKMARECDQIECKYKDESWCYIFAKQKDFVLNSWVSGGMIFGIACEFWAVRMVIQGCAGLLKGS